MAKQQRRAAITKNKDQQGHLIEETFDDNLLPDASEITKLYQIDPNIMDWLKDRAEREQEFRHKTFETKLEIASKTERGLQGINYLGLILSFVLLLAGMYLSYTLIVNKREVLGSVFSGVMLVAIASIYMSKVRSNNGEKTPR